MKSILSHRRILHITCFCVFCCILYSCVNDLDSIKRVTYRSDAPDDVTENLEIIQTDSGYARFQLFAKIAETYTKPEALTKLKGGIKVNFFSDNGEIVSCLTALYGEINMTKGSFFVRDSVQLVNFEKDQRLETEELIWNQKDSAIYTNKAVIVRTKQGILFGTGIRTQQDFSKYVFLKPTGKIDFDKK